MGGGCVVCLRLCWENEESIPPPRSAEASNNFFEKWGGGCQPFSSRMTQKKSSQNTKKVLALHLFLHYHLRMSSSSHTVTAFITIEQFDDKFNVIGSFDVCVEGHFFSDFGDYDTPPVDSFEILSSTLEDGSDYELCEEEEHEAKIALLHALEIAQSYQD
jgi:hypothetical protein